VNTCTTASPTSGDPPRRLRILCLEATCTPPAEVILQSGLHRSPTNSSPSGSANLEPPAGPSSSRIFHQAGARWFTKPSSWERSRARLAPAALKTITGLRRSLSRSATQEPSPSTFTIARSDGWASLAAGGRWSRWCPPAGSARSPSSHLRCRSPRRSGQCRTGLRPRR